MDDENQDPHFPERKYWSNKGCRSLGLMTQPTSLSTQFSASLSTPYYLLLVEQKLISSVLM
jgi:hypothetical protein